VIGASPKPDANSFGQSANRRTKAGNGISCPMISKFSKGGVSWLTDNSELIGQVDQMTFALIAKAAMPEF
jgi:hypothetical protein